MKLRQQVLQTDILIIGGGTAGCFAAYTAARDGDLQVIVAEKADVERSGCLAAGVNALNAYINPGHTPEDYLAYVRQDAEGVVREDLVYSAAQRLNAVTRELEKLGLVIQKEADGTYVARGQRNIVINGENIKPLLAAAARQQQVTILNHVNMTDYLQAEGLVIGACGFSVNEPLVYFILAKAVICAAGGAAGIYKPNNPGFSRHKMWYCPFNTGAGYAMGIRAGAEMTSLEMRFIALRCKDTIAPTGTLAQGVQAGQVNAYGEPYEKKYGALTTANRVYSTVMEERQGKGPCYLATAGISEEEQLNLYKAYLNMAPAQTLKWLDTKAGPAEANVEIVGSEPYLVGGHAGAGYWVGTDRATTLPGLFAAGDVAGGSPQKYVTGCLAEAEIAVAAAAVYCRQTELSELSPEQAAQQSRQLTKYFANPAGLYQTDELEEAMQTVMDRYAGGISTGYGYNLLGLGIAEKRLRELWLLSEKLRAEDMYGLLKIRELVDRLEVSLLLLKHLAARKETRWHAFQENLDYPAKDDAHWLKYVNSRVLDGKPEIILRKLVAKEEVYEHQS